MRKCASAQVPVLDPVDAILAHHGIEGPWQPLKATGLANRIYATRDVVLRIATDHPDAIVDARTESVAAPVARAAGVLVPRLIAFDDSRTIVDRPYSIWERIHGATLGLLPPSGALAETWMAVGAQLARLHRDVRACPDPKGWLDEPGREFDLSARISELTSAPSPAASAAIEIAGWIDALRPAVTGPSPRCFIHNDVHEMNVMCSDSGELLAVIDWGDAGWGDPTLEFAQVPLEAVPYAVAGYEAEAPGTLGDRIEVRIIWDKLGYALEALPDMRLLSKVRTFLRTGSERWRVVRLSG